ncbi:hydantoinase/carbamoylase family amidase [Jannaschia ovalis]|uniref:Hydantoinase/carbamoylase family amidase n=1 Tax=Jannaschia ovalis TaxID=3038773 RepID=A0ABY8L850_9RHOB|nr:hydantoinase/carbamoylase family amidase [Jannaschia sp. GRR-S6-38]WGH77542.1 hydantoinase/carbamoylase family amidase [Jannaschia sp. GRR-S6-38]
MPDAARFLADLDALRAIGARGTGVVRRAFDEADIHARRWLADRFADAGLEARIDPAGNVWGLRGRLLIGSHIDTQPEGGWLDGALGVIAGLEVARGNPGVSVVAFQDEEGRFGATTGSEIWSGTLTLAEADALTDLDGLTFGAARAALPATGAMPDPSRFSAYLEPHIEQGPVLDAAGEAVGVVTAIVGLRQVTVTLTGAQNHAGTTPMHLRRDALRGLSDADHAIRAALAPLVTPASVWTIGHVALHPNAPSAVPGRARFTVQWRDAETARLDAMEAAIRAALEDVTRTAGLGLEISATTALPPTAMDPGLRAVLRDAAAAHAPDRWREMPSGALHDATNVARLMPAGMLFAPSIGGISHDFAEDTGRDDLAICLAVLAEAAARLT